MPYSSRKFDHVVRYLVRSLDNPTILDIGAGAGKFGRMFRDEFDIDAVEPHLPYIASYNLGGKYREVHNCSAQQFVKESSCSRYDLAILGDVLEHLSVSDAQEVIRGLLSHNVKVVVVVPYLYEQGPSYGNELETHLQPDLTRDVMADRYPELIWVDGNDEFGVFKAGF